MNCKITCMLYTKITGCNETHQVFIKIFSNEYKSKIIKIDMTNLIPNPVKSNTV